MKTKVQLFFLIVTLLAVSGPAFGQDATTTEYVPTQEELAVDHGDSNLDNRKGLDGALGVSANLNLIHNSNVVGQVDGFTTVFGLGLTGGLDWLHGRHEIRNTLSIDESWARTPALDKFVKNSDLASLTSQYNYFFLDWMGAYGRLSFETSLFPTYDYRSKQYTYQTKMLDNSTESTKGSEILLSSAFKPFNMTQSVGLVADPLTMDEISLTARLGVGGRENFAKGVRVIDSSKSTDTTLALTELDNVYQFGAEAYFGGNGKFYEGRLTYSFGMSVLIPFANNNTSGKSAWELTRFGANAQVYFAVFSWMGLTYKLFFVSDPQLLDKAQVQNSLLATFNYTFIERGHNTGDVAQAELERAEAEKVAAEKKAAAAEARAQAAEQRAAQAEAAAIAASAEAKTASDAAKEENTEEDAVETSESKGSDSDTTPPAADNSAGSN